MHHDSREARRPHKARGLGRAAIDSRPCCDVIALALLQRSQPAGHISVSRHSPRLLQPVGKQPGMLRLPILSDALRIGNQQQVSVTPGQLLHGGAICVEAGCVEDSMALVAPGNGANTVDAGVGKISGVALGGVALQQEYNERGLSAEGGHDGPLQRLRGCGVSLRNNGQPGMPTKPIP